MNFRCKIPLFSAVLFLILISLYAADEERRAAELFNEGSYTEAAQLLEGKSRTAQLSAGELSLLGLAYIRTGRLDEAEQVIALAEARDSLLPLVYFASGNLLFERGEYEAAIKKFDFAYRLDRSFSAALKGMSAARLNAGIKQYEAKDAEAAKRFFKAVIADDPDSVAAYRNLSLICREEGEAEKAESYLRKALSIDPDDQGTLQLLAALLSDTGRRAEYIETLTRLADFPGTDASVYVELGRYYEEAGLNNRSLDFFRKADRAHTDDPYPYFRLAEAEKSIPYLYLAVGKAVQRSGLIQMQAANAVEGMGEEMTAEDVRRLEALSGELEEPEHIIDRSLRLLREFSPDRDEYHEHLSTLCEWYPYSIPLKSALSSFYAGRGEWEKAETIWREILDRSPVYAEGHKGLGKVLEAQDRFQEAALEYRKALSLDPHDQELYELLYETFRTMQQLPNLRRLLLDLSYIETRNPVLFTWLSRVEAETGFSEEAALHKERAEQFEREQKQQSLP
jgi:tetratricopeptide (TPR) repeat protein